MLGCRLSRYFVFFCRRDQRHNEDALQRGDQYACNEACDQGRHYDMTKALLCCQWHGNATACLTSWAALCARPGANPTAATMTMPISEAAMPGH